LKEIRNANRKQTEDKMKISIQVSWLERGKTYNLKALEYLTNWQK